MLLYQAPLISTIRQEPFQSQLQYQPDCFGDACSQFLGLDDICDTEDGIANLIGVRFFLPGRTDPNPPFGCIIVAQESGNGSHNGTSCSYELDASCPEGQVWEVECQFNALCNGGGLSSAQISCDGELSSVCSGGAPA